MAYVLHLPAAFFRSRFVPAQSVFSDQTAALTTYDWRPFAGAPDEIVRIPCAAGEAEDWRLRTRGAHLIAGLFAAIGLAVLAISQVTEVNPKERLVGMIFGVGLLALGIYRAVKTGGEAVRLEARPDTQAVTIVWPSKLFFIYNIYAAALIAWRKQGSPAVDGGGDVSRTADPAPSEAREPTQDSRS